MVQYPTPVCTGCGVDHITVSCPLTSTHMNQPVEVLAIEAVNSEIKEPPSFTPVVVIKAYLPPIPFFQRLQRNETGKEQVEYSKKSTEKDQQMPSNSPQVGVKVPIKALTHPVSLPQRLKNTKLEKQFTMFLEVLKQLHVNIHFIEVIPQIPNYFKFLKKMLTKKRKLPEHETRALFEECSAIIQRRIPPKLKDPGNFTLPFSIGILYDINCLINLGASINLIPFPLYRKVGLRDLKVVSIILQLMDRSLKYSYGIVQDMLIKVGEFIFLADFIILGIEEACQMPIILGRPFLSTSQALLDFDANEIVLKVEDKQQSFTMENPIKQPLYFEDCQQVDYWESYKDRPNEGRIVGRDNDENLVIWRMTDKRMKCDQCMKCRVENSLFKPP
ncbi:uncharacterized protein LOC111406777 [Olea europaea var. sylvestris]|uniref:uncharacterized protein LOC111406777 n=1 Tax=Olea europaea var. sylvestris TaxID=158386 RepID=UPI000C1D316D|nr:uncharacterized protein LOC111406777 [Olea europaea var. sylvestris]